MRRFVRRIFILCVLLLVTAVGLDILFTGIFRRGLTYKSQWVAQMEGEHYDAVFAGSSRAYWNIDHGEIGRQCGMQVISLASSGYAPAEMLLSLRTFLAGGNSTDKLYLQVDYRTLGDDRAFTTNTYHYMPFLRDEVVYDHLKDRSTEFRLLHKIPFARYGRYNFVWGPEEVLMTVTGLRNTIFDSTGSFFTDMRFRGGAEWPYELTVDRPPDDVLAIVDLCRRNNIRIELYMTPYYRLRLPEGTRERLHRMYADLDLVMHDYSQTLDSTIYFDDNAHLNREGGRIFTRMLVGEVVCPGRAPGGQPE
jgi:hypothetical protein